MAIIFIIMNITKGAIDLDNAVNMHGLMHEQWMIPVFSRGPLQQQPQVVVAGKCFPLGHFQCMVAATMKVHRRSVRENQ